MHHFPVNHQLNQALYSRQQPFPYPVGTQQNVPYNQQNNFYPQNFLPYAQPVQPVQPVQQGMALQTNPYYNQYPSQKDSQFLFQNPLQPAEDMIHKPYTPYNGNSVMNPYPKNNLLVKQPSGMQSFMNSFKSQDGSIDFNKMMNTAGQMMNAVNQVSSLVKGVGGMFKAAP
ncbi:hypothetical protein HPT25_24735 [Bacillus sp. BRMEA1]|nr:hypothetical protein [Neobacillus endophyticus]